MMEDRFCSWPLVLYSYTCFSCFSLGVCFCSSKCIKQSDCSFLAFLRGMGLLKDGICIFRYDLMRDSACWTLILENQLRWLGCRELWEDEFLLSQRDLIRDLAFDLPFFEGGVLQSSPNMYLLRIQPKIAACLHLRWFQNYRPSLLFQLPSSRLFLLLQNQRKVRGRRSYEARWTCLKIRLEMGVSSQCREGVAVCGHAPKDRQTGFFSIQHYNNTREPPKSQRNCPKNLPFCYCRLLWQTFKLAETYSCIKLLMNYRTAPAFTLPLSQKKTIYQMPAHDYSSPGPVYNTWGLGIKQVSTSHSIGNSKRTKINHWVEHTPSPAQYSPQKKHKEHRVAIPKATLKEEINSNPEPGCYNPELQTIRPKSPQFTMSARYPSIMDDVNDHPGPGKYNNSRDMPILSKSKSEKASLFATASRFQAPNDHPGVGDYQVTNKSGMITNKGTIGIGQRDPLAKPAIPAPTDYNKVSQFDDGVKRKIGKSISMKLKGCFQDNPLTSQAFHKYFDGHHPQPAHFRSTQQLTIPKEKREVFSFKRTPGPSDYNSHAYVYKSSAKAIIPASTYEPYNEVIDHPAPGAYKITIQKGPKYTIPRAKSATIVRDHPGVGRYTVTQGIQARVSSAIPKSARTNFISKNTAGVGDYQLQQKQKFKGTIGKSQRFKKIEKLPGPGDYHIQSILGYKSKHL